MVEDYRVKYNTGRGYVKGLDIKGKKIYGYQRYYCTEKYGNMEPEKWRKAVMEEIQHSGEEKLLERIKHHCRRHCAWLHKEQEIEDYAMEILASRSYLHWEDFQSDTEIIWM